MLPRRRREPICFGDVVWLCADAQPPTWWNLNWPLDPPPNRPALPTAAVAGAFGSVISLYCGPAVRQFSVFVWPSETLEESRPSLKLLWRQSNRSPPSTSAHILLLQPPERSESSVPNHAW